MLVWSLENGREVVRTNILNALEEAGRIWDSGDDRDSEITDSWLEHSFKREFWVRSERRLINQQ